MSSVVKGSRAQALLMKRGATLAFQGAITAAPLMVVLGILYATGALQGGSVATAVFTALVTAAAVEPVRSMLTRTAFADQQRVMFCAQAMIALQVAGDLVADILLRYHPGWHPKPTDAQKARGERIVETLLPVVGLASMWAPTAAGPLDVLVAEMGRLRVHHRQSGVPGRRLSRSSAGPAGSA
jgi:hypothetical protein